MTKKRKIVYVSIIFSGLFIIFDAVMMVFAK